jgi:orotate phosphoribosyltransferase
MPDRDDLARRIYAAAHLTGTFTLRSGVTSSEYFDKYLFEADPVLLADIADAMVRLLPPGADALAGLELGGIPIVTMLSQRTGLPALFVRKAAKEYGTCRLAEGGDVAGRHLVIVEDVVTSGGAVVDAWRELQALGATADTTVCVIDRQSSGADNLAAVGLRLAPLFTMTELQGAASA